ncbi:GNAT family N-acetyltransferase [Sorangium sp. So ce185]|uniref:GNAT family N-acetyltransferase n=1 Tax=Sorangium sp. So ce185 TaxID=3133287 RepID=UPI003F60E00A
MSSATTLRADPAHIPLVLDMMVDFNAGEEIPWDRGAVEASLRRLLADAALGFVVVAVTARGLEGYAVVTFNFDLEFRGRDAFVTELYVRPAARGVGLGRLLLASAEAMAVEEDARAPPPRPARQHARDRALPGQRLRTDAAGHDDQGARGRRAAVRRVNAGGHLPAGCAPG